MSIETEIENLKAKLNELMYAQVLQDCSSDSEWLKKRNFTLTKGAANYSFIYILFKLIDEIHPKNILEMGLGQTTKLTTQYANFYDDDVVLDVIEHDQQWIDVFCKKLELTPNINVVQKDLTDFYYNNTISCRYEPLEDVVKDKKYDLVIIDGPFGFNSLYPRTNVLDLIPNNLADKFVIILDDSEREGEKNTAGMIFDKLDLSNIQYNFSYQAGTKTQLIISSLDYVYINWL